MKLQIDTTGKTIKIEESVKLTDLFSMIKKLLPNDAWKEYSLEQSTIGYWANPIYIDRWQPQYPSWTTEVSFGGMSETVVAEPIHSVYCIEMN